MAPLHDVSTDIRGNIASNPAATGTHAGGSGSNRLVIAKVFWSTRSHASGANFAITSVTYGGAAMTSLGAVVTKGNQHAQLYYLINPAAGSQTVTVNNTADHDADPIQIFVSTFTDADQSTGVQNYTSASGTTTAPAVTLTSAVGNLGYGATSGGDSGTQAISSDVPPTETLNTSYSVNGDPQQASAGYATGAASIAFSWTIGGTSLNWIAMACDIIAASGGGATPFAAYYQQHYRAQVVS